MEQRTTILGSPLLDCLSYDPETGVVTYTKRRSNCLPGRVVKPRKGGRYAVINCGRNCYYLHRVIWALQTGEEPPEFIDHINGDKTDNRWCNLRAATRGSNRHNQNHRGYYYDTTNKKWVVQLKVDGVHHRTYHDTEAEAAEGAVVLRDRLIPNWHRVGA